MLSLQFSKRNILLLGVFTSLAGFVLLTGRAHAASFSVAAGTDAISADSTCRLSEALQNIDDQAQTNADCPAGNSNNDTIQLPAGTITLSASSYLENDFFGLNKTVGAIKNITIKGQSKSQSIIDGNNEYLLFSGAENTTIKYQDFTFKSPPFYGGIGIMNASSSSISNVDVDGEGACIQIGIAFSNTLSGNNTVTIEDSYVHDISCTANGSIVMGIVVDNMFGGTTTLTANNITVNNIDSNQVAIGFIYGISVVNPQVGVSSHGSMNATIKNTTVNNVQSDGMAAGLGPYNVNMSEEDNTLNSTVRDVTLTNILSEAGEITPQGADFVIFSRAYGAQVGEMSTGKATINSITQNIVIANSVHNNQSKDCAFLRIDNTGTYAHTSSGGNTVEDATCTNYFNKNTDKNNVTTLKDTLNTLADNGGNVPTILPKAGSPVIDGGVCTDAPTTDARGVSRPQGKTCDSGAVEVQQASLASEGGLTSVDGKSQIYIDPPVEGAVITSATLAEVGESNDSAYEYPYGMVGFTVAGVPSGSTQTINLYFETDKAAEQFVARKYISADKKYIDLPDAQITNTTRNNKPVVKVSYQIQDGGELDADGQANGSITDPVGIALESGMLLNTGVPAIIFSLVGAILVLGAALTYFDYRKHKSPLLEADNETHSDYAKQYTFLHHIKTVTIPTARHKFTIRLEKQVKIEA